MNKYKICIYAICKNEEKYIDTWYNSVKEADKIFILDTGSTDNTFNLLKDKEEFLNSKTLLEDEYSSMAKIKRSRTNPEIQEYNKKISYSKYCRNTIRSYNI